jgi:hypothetical protein
LIVEEAGSVVTDSQAISLNFGLGRTLGELNYGVIAAGKGALSSVQSVLSETK